MGGGWEATVFPFHRDFANTSSEATSSAHTRSEDSRSGKTSPSCKTSGLALSGSHVVFSSAERESLRLLMQSQRGPDSQLSSG